MRKVLLWILMAGLAALFGLLVNFNHFQWLLLGTAGIAALGFAICDKQEAKDPRIVDLQDEPSQLFDDK